MHPCLAAPSTSSLAEPLLSSLEVEEAVPLFSEGDQSQDQRQHQQQYHDIDDDDEVDDDALDSSPSNLTSPSSSGGVNSKDAKCRGGT